MSQPARVPIPLLRFGIESGIETFDDLTCSGEQQEIKLADLVEVCNYSSSSMHPLLLAAYVALLPSSILIYSTDRRL